MTVGALWPDRSHDVYDSLPRLLVIALDSVTLARTALDQDRYHPLIESITTEGLADQSVSQPARWVADPVIGQGAPR